MSEEKAAEAYQEDLINYKSGYLVKQGGRIKTWKRRLFILDRRNKVLKYYKKPSDTIPKGVIHVEGYQVGDADEVLKKNFAITMSKEGFRAYFVVCDDLQTKLQWMEELKETARVSTKGPNVTVIMEHSNPQAQSYDVDTDDDDETLRRIPPASKDPALDLTYANKPRALPVDEGTLFAAAKKEPEPPVKKPTYSTYTGNTDPNATLMGEFYDDQATLMSDSHPRAVLDPNATLMAMGGDPNATLLGAGGLYGGGDPNATLIGGGGDENATLVADGGPMLINNSAKIRAMAQAPQIVPHIKLIPYNAFHPVVETDVLRTLKFGRKKEDGNNDPDFIGFDTKVVSRRHSEIWAVNGDFYIRDTKSQSGTFLNAMRLSLPGEESKPFKLKNGDTIQFGVDYRGSVDNTSKCVSMTIEISFSKAGDARHVMPTSHFKPNTTDLTLVAGK